MKRNLSTTASVTVNACPSTSLVIPRRTFVRVPLACRFWKKKSWSVLSVPDVKTHSYLRKSFSSNPVAVALGFWKIQKTLIEPHIGLTTMTYITAIPFKSHKKRSSYELKMILENLKRLLYSSQKNDWMRFLTH